MTEMTPQAWLEALSARLAMRSSHMLLMDRYYRGEHALPFLTRAHEAKMRDEFRRLLDESRSNFMRLVVDAVEERMSVEGFRLSADTQPVADKDSWAIWQANQMDAQSQTGILESLIKGVSYLSVWEDEDGDGYADIAVEDPLQTIVAYEAGSNFRRRAAAVKVWLDEWTGDARANVYLPNSIHKFQSKGEAQLPTVQQAGQPVPQKWEEIEGSEIANPLGVVPIIPLRNRPRLLVEGESELEDVIKIQNQINAFIFLQALAGYFGAHKQRWAVGLTLMEDKNGKPVEPFNVAVDKMLATDNKDVKFGEFSATDLGGYRDTIEQKVLHIAVTTRTPRHYLIQQGQSPSGDAIASAEAGLIKKVTRKQRTVGEGFEEAIRLARRAQGLKEAPVDSEVVWADPSTHSQAAVTDSVVKQYFAGLIPDSMALEQLGYTQTQIRQIENAPEESFVPPSEQALVDSVEKSALLGRAKD